MPRPTKGTRLGGSPAHQRLILASLATALFEHRSITTTETKARRVQPLAEKLITKARRGDLHSRRTVAKVIRDKNVLYQLFDVIAPAIDEGREGGYTRIVKTAPRRGDNAPMAVISLVLEKVEKKPAAKDSPKATAKKAAKKPVPDVDETPEKEEVTPEDEAAAPAADDTADETVEETAETADDSSEK